MPMRFEVQLGFLVTLFGVVFCACPSGWRQHYDDCFLVVNESQTLLEAKKDCGIRHPGGHLFYLKSLSDRYYSYQANKLLNLTESEVYYVGAERNASGWFWGNGKKLSLSSHYWLSRYSSSEGNYLTVSYKTSSFDGFLGSYSYLKLRGVDGSSKHKYICGIEENLVNTSAKGTSSVVMTSVASVIKSAENELSTSTSSRWTTSTSLPTADAPLSSSLSASSSSSSSSSSSAAAATTAEFATSSAPMTSALSSASLFSSTANASPSISAAASTTHSPSSSLSSSLLKSSPLVMPKSLSLSPSPTPSLSSSFPLSSSKATSSIACEASKTSVLPSFSGSLSSANVFSLSPSSSSSSSSSKVSLLLVTSVSYSFTSATLLPSLSSHYLKSLVTSTNIRLSLDATIVSTPSDPGVGVVPSSTLSVQVSPVSSSGARDTSTSSNDIDSFVQNISKLDFKDVRSLNKSLSMMEDLLTAMQPAGYSTNHNPLIASKTLEEFAFRYMDYHWNGTGVYYDQQNIVLQAEKCYPENGDYTFRISERDNVENVITLPKENFESNGTMTLSIAFKRLDQLMDGQSYELGNDSFRYKLKSRIISTSMKPRRETLENNATMFFKISAQTAADTEAKKACVFWHFSTTGYEEDSGWSSDGCVFIRTTGEYVECSCNHLTHFAVLMRIDKKKLPRNEDAILTILTNFGLGLSIVGCVITFFSYWFFTEAKSEQSQIRMNLVFVLTVAHILFLLGSPARFHLVICVTVAVLLQLFYTSALCWMFAEGIQLYMQVIKVFNTNLKMRRIYGFAWGFPLLLITVSLSIAGNGAGGLSSFVNDDFCWLSVENHLIWTFIAPVILLILGNLVVLGMVVKEMSRINHPIGDKHGETTLRSSVKALIVLAPLLGVTWLVGLLCILGADVIGLYIFTVLNSIQGFLIFVFHCWRNSEIQGKFRRKVQALEENRSKHEDVFHTRNYRHRKRAFTKRPTKSKRPKARKQSPGGLTISDFDSSDFVAVEFKHVSTKF